MTTVDAVPIDLPFGVEFGRCCYTCVHWRGDKPFVGTGSCDAPLPLALIDPARRSTNGMEGQRCPMWQQRPRPL